MYCSLLQGNLSLKTYGKCSLITGSSHSSLIRSVLVCNHNTKLVVIMYPVILMEDFDILRFYCITFSPRHVSIVSIPYYTQGVR